MQLVEYFYLDNKNESFERLTELSNAAKNLYNQALYTVIEYYKNNNKFLFYRDLDKIMKTMTNLEGNIN